MRRARVPLVAGLLPSGESDGGRWLASDDMDADGAFEEGGAEEEERRDAPEAALALLAAASKEGAAGAGEERLSARTWWGRSGKEGLVWPSPCSKQKPFDTFFGYRNC